MVIDNFDIIRSLINFEKSDNKFFHAQIVKRQKDHPGETVSESAINTYYIRSKKHLDRLIPEMKMLADFHGARIYINVSPKSFKKLNEMVMTEMLRKNFAGEIGDPNTVIKSMAGKLRGVRDEQYWVIDVDDDTKEYFELIKQWLIDNGQNDFIIVPTKSFNHILAHPFNRIEFISKFPHIHLHENSMGTLAYANI